MYINGCFRPFVILLKLVLVVGLLLFPISPLPILNAQAASSVPPDPNIASPDLPVRSRVYVPVILDTFYSGLPRLISPANGAQLDTLIPTFSWDFASQPPDTVACFALDINPHPADCQMTFWVENGYHWEGVMWYNLLPGTVYYWRVGLIFNYNYDRPQWSEERKFTTGPVGGVILPAPELSAPANKSVVPSTDLTLTWDPVGGAVLYSISVQDRTNNSSYDFYSTEPNLNLSEAGWFMVTSNTNYEWTVIARNDYAWGNSSASWSFSTTAQ